MRRFFAGFAGFLGIRWMTRARASCLGGLVTTTASVPLAPAEIGPVVMTLSLIL